MPRPRKRTWRGHHLDEQDKLNQRIDECTKVIDHIGDCPAWQIIFKDLTEQKQLIDDNWQNITEQQKLDTARNLKHAYMHLINIRDKYELDLESARANLKVFQNPDKSIPKDYDEE